MIKLKVCEKTLRYSKIKTKQAKQREIYVEQTIARLQEELENRNTDCTLSSHLEEQLNESRLELEKIIEFHTKGAVLRSKTRWYNEGEKNTIFFVNLQKRHCKQETISQINLNDREFVTSDENILTECVSFYRNLYSSKRMTYDQNVTTFFPEREDESAIHDHELTARKGALTEKECLEAVKDMETEKNHGTEGLPAKFYKVFLNDISVILIGALNYAYAKLDNSQ